MIDLRGRVLAHLSLHGPTLYAEVVNEVDRSRPTQIWHIMDRAVRRGTIISAVRLPGESGSYFRLAEGYEWHGARAGGMFPAQYHVRYTRLGVHKLGCYAKHTAGFECHRAPEHFGRHASSGTLHVLASWLPGGRFDPAAAFTDAERRALDIDAASAFFE